MNNQELMADGVFTVREASEFAKRSTAALYVDMKEGRLRYVKYGKSRRIPKRALIDFIARHAIDGE